MTQRRFEIRLSANDVRRLETALTVDPERESAAFILAGESRVRSTVRLLARRVVEVPECEYRVRTRHHIDLSPRAVNGLVALCEASGLRAILCHSHPDDVPYSPSDDHGERRVAETLQAFFPGQLMGSLLLRPIGFEGRVWLPNGVAHPVSAITAVGRSIRQLRTVGNADSALRVASAQIHDRQIRAFGQAGQALVEATKVGIVGVGGSGSPLAEQFVRLGVRDLLLIDRDEIVEPSNLSRVYGTRFTDIHPSWWRRLPGVRSKPKVVVVGDHLREINPRAHIQAVKGDVTNAEVARNLLDRDVIFACTDEHWGRAVVNQIAYQFLIPVVNLGVAMDGSDGAIKGATGAVQVLRPGLGCLWCGNYLNSDRIRAESLPADARRELEAEGYLRGLPEAAPSVVTITTAVAGLAGTIFLQLVTDFMQEAGEISRINYFPLEGLAARGRVPVKTPCLCSKVKARGDLDSLPVVPQRSGG